jgi:hypothetical protein
VSENLELLDVNLIGSRLVVHGGKITPFPAFYQKVMVDAKYLIWEERAPASPPESEGALQGLRLQL